jgi:hypothetical protein
MTEVQSGPSIVMANQYALAISTPAVFLSSTLLSDA